MNFINSVVSLWIIPRVTTKFVSDFEHRILMHVCEMSFNILQLRKTFHVSSIAQHTFLLFYTQILLRELSDKQRKNWARLSVRLSVCPILGHIFGVGVDHSYLAYMVLGTFATVQCYWLKHLLYVRKTTTKAQYIMIFFKKCQIHKSRFVCVYGLQTVPFYRFVINLKKKMFDFTPSPFAPSYLA